jgi:uncharacterized membrane protein YesL
MSRFFSTENPVFGALEYIMDLVWLSILWLIFCIPVITAGASITALYYTATKVIRHHRGYIAREFWHALKSNFRQSTVIWLLYLLVLVILGIDMRIMSLFGNTTAQAMQCIFAIGMIIATAILLYALSYTARFVQNVRGILKNSVFMAFRHLPLTVLVVLIAAAAGYAIYLSGFAIVLVPAVAAILESVVLESIFTRYMSEEDRKNEQIRNHPEQYEYMHLDQ